MIYLHSSMVIVKPNDCLFEPDWLEFTFQYGYSKTIESYVGIKLHI